MHSKNEDSLAKYRTGDWFGPDWQPFEVLGYFEDLLRTDTGKYLGMRKLDDLPLGRLPGSNHSVDYDFNGKVELRKGTKPYLWNTNGKKIRVRSTIQIMCGRVKESQT